MTDRPAAPSPAAPARGNRRTQRTRARLREALLDLVAERGLGQLAVSDVTKRADVNRSTFYEHYTDVHDLAAAACAPMCDAIVAAAPVVPPGPAPSREPLGRNALTALFTRVAEHADLYRALLGPEGSARVIDTVRHRLAAALQHGLTGADPGAAPPDPRAAALAGALLGTAADWLARPHPEPAATLSAALWPQLDAVATALNPTPACDGTPDPASDAAAPPPVRATPTRNGLPASDAAAPLPAQAASVFDGLPAPGTAGPPPVRAASGFDGVADPASGAPGVPGGFADPVSGLIADGEGGSGRGSFGMLCGFGRHSAARGSGEGTAVEAVAAGRGHAPLHGQLLEAALVLFVERGYRGTSLQEIASAAGCSKASVLYHFSDKKAILRELLTPAIQGVVELNGRLHAVPDDRVARVAVEGFVEIALRYRREVALLLSDVPEVSEILVGPVDLAAVLLDAMAGRSRAPEAELRAWTALGCVVMGSAGSTDLILPFEEMRAHLVQATLRVLALPDG